MENKSIYTAVTIGPIYKTLSIARKTRELWGASYLFSFIMRRIIEKLNDTSKCCLPFYNNMLIEGLGKGAGLYPDRLIYEGNVKPTISSIEMEIIDEISAKSGLSKSYLENYIRIYTVTFSLPVAISENPNECSNIVIVSNKLLDTIELKEKYYNNITTVDWPKAIDKLNGSLFYAEAFKDKDTRFQFPSIIEIATDDFRQKNEIKYMELVQEHLKSQEESDQIAFLKSLAIPDFSPLKVRPYHKYIAVVQADGDNIGKTIGKIGNDTAAIRNFSAALFDFAMSACQAIKKYGGKSVYVGGDDLLFFAPVAVFNTSNNDEPDGLKTIFNLIADIDKIFKEKVLENVNLKSLYEPGGALEYNVPSMSYGVSVTYSKFPLNEARENAYNLLRQAKENPNDKNKICFKVNKHSGQGFGFMVDKKRASNNPQAPLSYDIFLGMLTNVPLQEDLISSIIYKLSPLHKLLNSIASDKTRVDIFFEQEFDLGGDIAWKSREERIKYSYIKKVGSFFHQLAIDFPSDNTSLPERETEQNNSNIVKLYSTLRFLKQLTDDDDAR